VIPLLLLVAAADAADAGAPDVAASSWPAVAAAGVAMLGTLIGALLQQRATASANRAEEAAERAAVLSAPTGNGYADRTTATLQRIEQTQQRTERAVERAVEQLLQHLQDHAGSDLDRRHPSPRE
jgi:hypothetical protein